MEQRDKSALTYFIFLAYGITWTCWIIAFILDFDDPTFLNMIDRDYIQAAPVLPIIIFRLGVYGPLIASLVIIQRYYKKEERILFFKRIILWHIHLKWYLIAFILPLIIVFIVWMIGLLLNIPSDAFFNSQISISLLLPFFLYQVFTSGLEEPGWRGFALEILQKSYTFDEMNWRLGTLWAIWHFPYVIFLYYTDGFVFTLVSLIGFTLSIIGQTFIISWLYLNTRSIFLMILFHAWLNTGTTLVLGDITIENPIMGTVPALVTWGIVLLLSKYSPVRTLKQQ
ncbi:type II CAAX prenyl endopeptidase Rce1 family protein [Alkalibacterium sp. f15]|uniref:CPBP family glutamic-type intramembrane protease n=1 Tax=Alkalibacterium sp. f15 TaxID=3414029 RepID=UPI003BF8C170